MTDSPKQELKIVSWNMWCFNPQLEDALAFIQETDADIFCLQEAPHEFIEMLQQLSYYIAYATDFEWITDFLSRTKDTSVCHLVIVSKHPLTDIAVHSADVMPMRTLWYKFFRVLMHYLAHWAGPTVKRETLSATARVRGKSVRIFSIHPPLVNATVRAQEIASILEKRAADMPTIICGDFNVLDNWMMKPLNLLIGGSIFQALPWFNERKRIEKQFADSGMVNALRGTITHGIARSQLDHILIPAGAKILERAVVSDTHGSDHNPVFAKVRI